jgi:Ca2+-binding EF-hand superfamily protein
MLSLGESLSDQDIEEMIKAASSDSDNSFVTLKDFVSIYLV